jgi:Flp pilus assembly pilin Flp
VRSAIEGAWGAIRSVVSGALSGIEGALSGAWATIQGGVSSAWAAIKGAVASAWSGIGGAVQSGIGTVVGFVSSLPGKIVGALGGLVGDMERVGAEAIHALLSGLESAAGSVAGEVGHVLSEINPLSHVSLPHLAEGGIVSKPTLALIGEAGDEAVIPLNQLGGAGALAGGGVSPLPSGGPAAHAATTGAPVFNTTIYSQGQPTSTLISELYLRLRPMLQGA